MIRKYCAVLFVVIAILICPACGAANDSGKETESLGIWQEQYDLGVRYLSEGKYQEAVIAFTAAIEIDEKNSLAYLGRGDAYIGMTDDSVAENDISENLRHAIDDYQMAIELDSRIPEAYKKLADIYRSQGDEKAAIDILEKGISLTGDEELKKYREQLKADEKMLPDEQGNSQFAVLGEEYVDFDFLSNVPMIGDKSVGETSFEEAVAYFGAEVGDGYEDIMVADIENSGPIDQRSGLGVHIQYNTKYDALSVSYQPYGRDPEFMGILQGDTYIDVLRKIGVTEKGMQLLGVPSETERTEETYGDYTLKDGTRMLIDSRSNICLMSHIGDSMYTVNIHLVDDSVMGVDIQAQKLK